MQLRGLTSCSHSIAKRAGRLKDGIHPVPLSTSGMPVASFEGRGSDMIVLSSCQHPWAALGVSWAYGRQCRRSLVAAASDAPGINSTSPPPRICILGGGFGGLYTAVKLDSLMWPKGRKPEVTVIDQNDSFVFKPLLYEVVNGLASISEVAPRFQDLLAPYSTQFKKGKVSNIEAEKILADGGSCSGGRVTLSTGEVVPYDWLVVALGAEANMTVVPGAKEYAVPFISLEDAIRIRDRVDTLKQQGVSATVAIIGAGYAGVELASTIGDLVQGHPMVKVKVFTPSNDILEGAAETQREAAKKVLGSQGVEIVTGTLVTSVGPAPPPSISTQCVLQLRERGSGGPVGGNAPPTTSSGMVTTTLRSGIMTTSTGLSNASQESQQGTAQPVTEEPTQAHASTTSYNNMMMTSLESGVLTATGFRREAGKKLGESSEAQSSSQQVKSPEPQGTAMTTSRSGEMLVTSSSGAGGSSTSTSTAQGTSTPDIGEGVVVDLVVWTAGSTPVTTLLDSSALHDGPRKGPPLPFPMNPKGLLLTEPTLQVKGHTHVFALGDVAGAHMDGVPTGMYPATAQVAFQQADYAAWNLWAGINKRPLLTFRYQHLGTMMALGQTQAAVALPLGLPEQITNTIKGVGLEPLLNTAGIVLGDKVTLEGPLAALLRRAAYLYRQPTNEQRLSVASSWLQMAMEMTRELGARGKRQA